MRRTAAEAAQTRRDILDAATLAFAERGYDGATFEHIGGRIGMTRGAVHHHFRAGKDELLAALLSEQWARYSHDLLAPLHAPGRSPRGRLEDFLVGYLDRLATDELFRALAVVQTLVAPRVRGGPEQGVEEHRRSLDGWRAALHDVLGEPGALRPGVTAGAAGFVVVTVLLGANDTAALEPDRLPRTDDERRTVAAAVTDGLLRGTPDERGPR